MSDQKLTDWFPADVKPAYVGVYQTKPYLEDTGEGFQYWDGITWRFWGFDKSEAFKCKNRVSGWQSPQWRGLASAPNA